jgi:hypothetical protein
MKTQRGNRGIAILLLLPRLWLGVDDQGQATAALPPGKELVLTVQEAG